MLMKTGESLSNLRVLVTRPARQGQHLAQSIRRAGGSALMLPMLEIQPLDENQTMRNLILDLDRCDKVVVTSQHAARFGVDRIDHYWPQLPLHTEWFAIGETTRQALETFDIHAGCSPAGTDSESLLALKPFQHVAGQRILLLKGVGGRDVLEQTLQQRGAIVTTLEVYQRQRPDYDPEEVRQQLAEHDINVILAASGETLKHLCHYLPSDSHRHCKLVTPGSRVTKMARALGFRQVYAAAGAGDAAMLAALKTMNSEESL